MHTYIHTYLLTVGHVYVIGNGTHGQFNSDPLRNIETKAFTFEFFDRVAVRTNP